MAKKKTVAALKKILWKHFAEYIKRRDKNICCTCGKFVTGREAGAGHYVPKGACGLEYYYSEKNVHCQCSMCNAYLGGNHPAYRVFLLQRYGQETLDDIERNYRNPYKGDSYLWLLEKIEHYKNENQ
jgi:hypothetical protein